MKQSKIFSLNVIVTLILVFGIAPPVVSKPPTSKEPNLTEQVEANSAAVTENAAAISAEAEARIADDNIVQGEIAEERSARIADDNLLQNNIDAEKAARIADDNYLQNLIEESIGDTGPADNIPGQTCPEGEFVTGIDVDGGIQCAPVDGGEPPPYKIIFLSSWTGSPAFGGLAAADAMCSFLARTAGLPGNYKAWLSDSTTSAADRLTHAEVPYMTPDGIVVAANWDDLTDGFLLNEINVDENGAGPYEWDTAVYTNTTPAGAISGSNPTNCCYDWTSATADAIAKIGYATQIDYGWTQYIDTINCKDLEDTDAQIHLYCVQQ